MKRIPLLLRNSRGSWFWILDEKGLFTVKSCHRKLQGDYNVPNSSFWKKMLSLKLPGKVINFLWRTCRACLPTAATLAGKMVPINTSCSWCFTPIEDKVHVLFGCTSARSVWLAGGPKDFLNV